MDPRVIGDERSLAIHARVAAMIREEPSLLAAARRRVDGWRLDGTVHRHYVDAWQAELGRPVDELCALLVERSDRARQLRQVSPFAGVVDPRARWRLWREVRERLEQP